MEKMAPAITCNSGLQKAPTKISRSGTLLVRSVSGVSRTLITEMLMTYEQSEWEIYVAGRTLSNDSTVPSVMDHNPFQGRDPPRWVRGEHVRRGSNVAHGKWWQRRRIRPHLKIDSFSSSENNQTDTVQPLRLYVMLFCVLCAKLFSVISFLSIVTVA